MNWLNHIAMDTAHAEFIKGAVYAKKPEKVLELGFGSGLVTFAISTALTYNQKGTIFCVDNWADWGGHPPAHARGIGDVQFFYSSEESFVRGAPADYCDILVSDADHLHSGEWFEHHCRITKPDGFMFFHDTNNSDFPSLVSIRDRVEKSAMPHCHFTTSSRQDERCERGLLFVINKK